MKRFVVLFFLTFILAGCGQRADFDKKTPSLSGKYSISAVVNQSKDDPTKYLCLKLQLFDSKGNLIKTEQTGASDTMKWALGWMKNSDTVVLFSSDIGTHAYDVNSNGLLVTTQVTPEIKSRALELKAEKYQDKF